VVKAALLAGLYPNVVRREGGREEGRKGGREDVV